MKNVLTQEKKKGETATLNNLNASTLPRKMEKPEKKPGSCPQLSK